MKVPEFAKSVVAGVGSVVTVLTAAFADDVLSLSEAGTLIATLVTAAGTAWATWRVPNRSPEQ